MHINHFKVIDNLDYADVAKSTAALVSESDKVTYVYEKLLENNSFDNFIFSKENLKSVEASIDFRKAGNECLKGSNLVKALVSYTKSIAKSEFSSSYCFSDWISDYLSSSEIEDVKKTDSCNLALAFANRSFVLFQMGYYELCLKDIERAEECDYPSHLGYKIHGRKAKCLLKLGARTDALKACEAGVASLSQATSLSDREKKKLKSEFSGLVDEINKLKGNVRSKTKKEAHTYFENIQVSYERNQKLPSATDAISITNFEGMGRGIVATRDIKVGDVLVVEEPFVSILAYDEKVVHYMYCSHCLKFCMTLIPCYRCSLAMFCSEQCREESWKNYHHVECYASSIAHPNLKFTSSSEQLALKVVVTASSKHESLPDFYEWFKSVSQQATEKGFDENGQYVSSDYRTMYHLATNIEKCTDINILFFALLAAFTVKFLGSKTKYFNNLKPEEETEIKMFIGGMIFRHLMNVSCNTYKITEKSEDRRAAVCFFPNQEIGAAVYAVSSLFNHSCNPNVVPFNYGGKIIMIAIQAIKKGAQVFSSYKGMFFTTPLAERKEFLGDVNFNFECKCEACEGNWPLLDQLPNLQVIKCQYCGVGLPQGDGIVRCRSCRKETDSAAIQARLYLQDLMMKSCQAKLPEEKIPVMAEILQEWRGLVDNPWKIYFGYIGNFVAYWGTWTNMRGKEIDFSLL